MTDTVESAHVLVVDDIEDNRIVLSRRLSRRGHEVATAIDGIDALEQLEAGQYDLVLLDIMMPRLDGYGVLEQMKADLRLRDIPVIVISALDQVESIVRCIKLGADDYLPKPFEPTILRARVDSCLQRKMFRDKEIAYTRQIEEEKARVNQLLRVILPDVIADELADTGRVEPRRHEDVAVLFADVVGFTAFCDHREPDEVLPILQEMVCSFEAASARHGLEKIKTIGDSYMGASGLLSTSGNPVENCVNAGQEMIQAANSLDARWQIRVGIHIGPVMAGIVGDRRFSFDLWGDTVNTAARVEHHGAAGCVNLSAAAWSRVHDIYPDHSSSEVVVKGKGSIEIIQLTAPSNRPE